MTTKFLIILAVALNIQCAERSVPPFASSIILNSLSSHKVSEREAKLFYDGRVSKIDKHIFVKTCVNVKNASGKNMFSFSHIFKMSLIDTINELIVRVCEIINKKSIASWPDSFKISYRNDEINNRFKFLTDFPGCLVNEKQQIEGGCILFDIVLDIE